ncbi:MAG: glycosyltransferase family 4 protein [Armatimonadetes bacterium]|nr:glycosyltransferase family 4 protein [Armatimonadota bacterium]
MPTSDGQQELRVLILRRQAFGAAQTLLDALATGLVEEGIDAVVDDAESWIPNKTGWSVDKGVSKAVKQAARGFDVVHAWGYRAAWACAEAFYVRSPWLYTAYEMPRTTQSELVDRLNSAHRGLCPTTAVKQELEAVDALNLEVVTPGVPLPMDPTLPQMPRLAARQQLDIRDDVKLIAGLGRFEPDKGFDDLAGAFERLRQRVPSARLLLSGTGSQPPPIHQEGMDVRGPLPSVWPALCAADLVVVPGRRNGFSLVGAEAMWAGAPVLFRESGGHMDMADEGSTGFFFKDDYDLADKIEQALELESTRNSVAYAGQLRAQARFQMARFCKDMARVYRELAGA